MEWKRIFNVFLRIWLWKWYNFFIFNFWIQCCWYMIFRNIFFLDRGWYNFIVYLWIFFCLFLFFFIFFLYTRNNTSTDLTFNIFFYIYRNNIRLFFLSLSISWQYYLLWFIIFPISLILIDKIKLLNINFVLVV